MKGQNEIIKEILQSKMEKLDDEQFTDRIVNLHLQKKWKSEKRVSFDFISLILGLISTIVSLVLGMLISFNLDIGLTLEHVIILFSISVIYLIYKLLNEITTPNIAYKT
jgi:heme/copper-type cytochrome/quinol oxidase subunit 2